MKITGKHSVPQQTTSSTGAKPEKRAEAKSARNMCIPGAKDSFEKAGPQTKVPFFSENDLRFELNKIGITEGGRFACVVAKALEKQLGAMGKVAQNYCTAFDAGRKGVKARREPGTLTRADAATNLAKFGAVGAQELLIHSKARTARALARRSALESLGHKPPKGSAGLRRKLFRPEVNKKADQIVKKTIKEGKKLLRMGKDVTDSTLKERIQNTVKNITKKPSAPGNISSRTAPAFRATSRLGRFLKRTVPVLNWTSVAIDAAKYNQVRKAYMKDKASIWKLGLAAISTGLSFVGAQVPAVGWGAALAGLARDVVR